MIKSNSDLHYVIRYFIIIFLPLVMLITASTTAIYYTEIRSNRQLTERNEQYLIPLLAQVIISDFKSVVSDLMILSEKNELQEMLKTGNPVHRENLAKEFLSYAVRKGLYDQIRFLDETGMEMVRVNFNQGNPVIVPDNQLQFKGGRYYFDDSFRLHQEEIFISPFDLNIEHGQIELPLKPMIRFGTPVFDRDSQKRGIVLLNYFGAKIIHDLESTYINSPGTLMLMNRDGFWFKGPRPDDEWGFMYEDRKRKRFGNAFPDAWKQISEVESGQFYNTNGLFTFTTVFPLSDDWKSSTGSGKAFESSDNRFSGKNYYWKVVSHIPPNVLKRISRPALNKLMLMNAILIPLITIGAWLLARNRVRRKQAEDEIREANQNIMESIQYAKMIQGSLLPNPEHVKTYLPHSFFIWMPRDIVGGDIFYTDSFENGFIVAVMDCTGHGVPGAFLSMIASSSLRRIVKEEACYDPAEILKQLNFIVKTTLQQDMEYTLSDDGLDAGILCVQYSSDSKEELNVNNASQISGKTTLTFAGAKLPLIYIHNNKLNIIKGDRQSIGYKRSDLNFTFTNHSINIEKGMRFYMATDGITDQMGGENKLRFGKKRLREILKQINHLPFETQQKKLLETFNEYSKNKERQDDVTVVGFGF